MKELLDDIVDRISEAADQVGKKADEVIETQRIKNKIRGLEKDNRRNFRDLGRMIYEKYQNGEEVEEEYIPFCEAVKEREEQIRSCEIELIRVKED